MTIKKATPKSSPNKKSHTNNTPVQLALIGLVRSQLAREPYYKYHTLSLIIKHFKGTGYTPRQVQKAVDALVLNREVKLERRILWMQWEVVLILAGGR